MYNGPKNAICGRLEHARTLNQSKKEKKKEKKINVFSKDLAPFLQYLHQEIEGLYFC